MKRFWIGVLALVWGSVLLTACGEASPRRSDFAYAEAAFSAVIRGTYTPTDGLSRPVVAEVLVGAPAGAGGERDMTVSFSEPSALAGVTVRSEASSEGDARAVTFTAASPHGVVTATAAHGEYDGFLRFAEALLPRGDVVGRSPVAEDGTYTVTRRTAEGDIEAVDHCAEAGEMPLRVTVRRAGEVLELAVTPGGEGRP